MDRPRGRPLRRLAALSKYTRGAFIHSRSARVATRAPQGGLGPGPLPADRGRKEYPAAVPPEFDNPPAFDICLRPGTDGHVLDAVGELDQDTGPLLNAAVDRALDRSPLPRELVVAMSQVAFCDSGGLNALIRAHLKARETGTGLHLLNPTGPVSALLRRTGADRVPQVSPRSCGDRFRAGGFQDRVTPRSPGAATAGRRQSALRAGAENGGEARRGRVIDGRRVGADRPV